MRGKWASLARRAFWLLALIIVGALADDYIAPHRRSGDGGKRRKTHLMCDAAPPTAFSPAHLTRLPAPMEPVETLDN
jgi:hypothetical protein